MKVLHITGGGDTGGGKSHILGLIAALQGKIDARLLCFLDGPVYQEAKAMGLPVELVHQERRYDITVVSKLKGMVEAGGYDLVHSHGSRTNFYTAFLKRWVKVPLVTTIHSDYQLDFLGNFYKQLVYTNLNKLALRFFDYYIGVSEHFRQMLIERGFPAERVFTVYNGLDFSQPPSVPLGRQEFLTKIGVAAHADTIVVGAIGRLHPVKGHGVLLKALPPVLDKYPYVQVIIAGDGEERDNLTHLAQQLGIDQVVHFPGFLQEPGLFFNAIDINVLPSNSESFPYVLLEGAQHKLATVATAVGGIPELVKDQETGFLFAPGDSRALTEKLLALLSAPILCQQLGEALYNHVRENFSTEKLADKQLEIYQQILAAQRGR